MARAPARTDDALRRQYRAHDRCPWPRAPLPGAGSARGCPRDGQRPGTRRPGRNFSSTPSCGSPCRLSLRWSRSPCSSACLRHTRSRAVIFRASGFFPGKRLLTLLFLLPLMVPPITYGIPLATVLYKLHLAGTIYGVILANLIPAAPFVILVMTPFIEQIDPNLESAARVFGAGTGRMFWHILVPLLGPGILAASLLVLVRTIALFELTFLTAGPDSRRWWSRCTTPCSRRACARRNRSTRWRWSTWSSRLRGCSSRSASSTRRSSSPVSRSIRKRREPPGVDSRPTQSVGIDGELRIAARGRHSTHRMTEINIGTCRE